jgi:hypothetical protein
MPNQRSGSLQLTLALADTNYYLPTLVDDVDPEVTKRCARLTIQADPSNTGDVLVGDASLSGTRYGAILAAGEAKTSDTGTFNGTSTEGVYLRATAVDQLVNVEISLV